MSAVRGARTTRLRVLPAPRGGWRVESVTGTQALCTTPAEAEAVATRLVHAAGGGEILVYDAYLRLRTSKRLGVFEPA